jgi:hypothetical protein
MSIFVSCPQDVLRAVLEFLSLDEIASFDSAVTNSTFRSSILDALERFRPSDLSDQRRSSDFVSWISLRKILISKLFFKPEIKDFENTCRVISESSLDLRELGLHGCTNFPHQSLNLCQQNLRNLVSADFSFCTSLTDSNLQVLSRSAHLSSLNLRRCWKLTSPGIVLLLQSCHKLKYVCFSGCNISDECLLAVSQQCPDLTGVDLSDCGSVTDVGVTSFSIHNGRLEHLNLSCCKNVTDLGLTAISQGCPLLSTLSLSYCKNISDISIVTLAKHCPGLAHIDLTGCWKISDQSIPDLLLGCRIKQLSLSGCCYVTDLSFALITAAECPDLEFLDLSGIPEITDKSLLLIPQSFIHLKQLTVSCSSISDKCLVALGAGCPSLSSLNLRYCKNISDEGLIEFAKLHRDMRALDLRECPGVSDRTLFALGACCDELSSLNLSGCSVTDAGLLELGKCCKNIAHLDLRGCSSLSDSSLWFVVQHCPALATLSTSGCDGITNAVLYQIKQQFPLIALFSN